MHEYIITNYIMNNKSQNISTNTSIFTLSFAVFIATMIVNGSSLGIVFQKNDIELSCTDQMSSIFTIPINSSSAFRYFSVVMEIKDIRIQPIVLAVFNDSSQSSSYSGDSPKQLTNTDHNSVQLGKNTQKLYYQSQPNQAAFYLKVYRLNLAKYSHSNNTDRIIQYYNGQSDKTQIYTCTIPSKFTITVTQITYNSIAVSRLMRAPFSAADCQNGGTFNAVSKQCVCKPDFGMDLCQVQFTRIKNVDEVHTKVNVQPDSKQYYYFESNETDSYQRVAIELKGSNSSDYSYDSTQANPQFNVLYTQINSSSQLQVSSIFHQLSPHRHSRILLRGSHKLMITVYKPKWAHAQNYQIKIGIVKPTLLAASQSESSLKIRVIVVIVLMLIIFIIFSYIRCKCNTYFGVVKYNKLQQRCRKQLGDQCWKQMESTICGGCKKQIRVQTDKQQSQQLTITYCRHVYHNHYGCQWVSWTFIRNILFYIVRFKCPVCKQKMNQQFIDKLKLPEEILKENDPIQRYIKLCKHANSSKGQQVNYCALETEPDTNRMGAIPDNTLGVDKTNINGNGDKTMGQVNTDKVNIEGLADSGVRRESMRKSTQHRQKRRSLRQSQNGINRNSITDSQNNNRTQPTNNNRPNQGQGDEPTNNEYNGHNNNNGQDISNQVNNHHIQQND